MSFTSPGDEKNDLSHKTSVKEHTMTQNEGYLDFDTNFEKFDIVYEINGEIFREKNMENVSDFCEFQINFDDEPEKNNIYLDVSIQEVEEGLIVDSWVFLFLDQWNTLMSLDELSFCLVCDEMLLPNADHITEKRHIENLQKYKPLKKFEYSITRMIGTRYHCAVCNNTFEINSEEEHFGSEHHKENMDFALDHVYENNKTISNGIYVVNGTNDKSVSNVDSEISEVYGESLKVPYNSWNMIISPWFDEFYCMACKSGDHISLKHKHCTERGHVKNLLKCRVLEEYDQVLIRKVDSKSYHCGYCNMLVLIWDVENHIARVHDNKSKNLDRINSKTSKEILNSTNKLRDSIPNKSTSNMHQSNVDLNNRFRNNGNSNDPYEAGTTIESNESFKNVTMNQSKTNVLRHLLEINNLSPGIHNDVTLGIFGSTFRISFMAYNTLIRDTERIYCALCDLSIHEKDILNHMADLNHLESLKVTQFDPYFAYNLIRVLHLRAHCSICNRHFHISSAKYHVTTLMHMSLLNQAKIAITSNTENNNLPKQIDLNHTMHPLKTDAQEFKIESARNIESLDDTNESLESYDHEFIYLNFKNTFYKITFNAYNSLFVIGNGRRYCFVCSVEVDGPLQDHIQSVSHTNCMNKCKFIDKYNKHVLRQKFLYYHCCTCNLIFTRKHLNTHLSWPLELIKTNKAIRKNDFKTGLKVIQAETQNEHIYLEMQEPKIEIIRQIKYKKPTLNTSIKKESKIVMVCSKILKISWDSWQGFRMNGNVIFCIICDKRLKEYELNSHINEEWHSGCLEKTFYKQYYPNLIRNINDKTANCVICNFSISNKKHIILEHLKGRKHLINDDSITINKDFHYFDNENVLYL